MSRSFDTCQKSDCSRWIYFKWIAHLQKAFKHLLFVGVGVDVGLGVGVTGFVNFIFGSKEEVTCNRK